MLRAVIVAVLFCVQFSFAIKCYDCNSHNNTMCAELAEYDEESRRQFLDVVDCNRGLRGGSQDFFCRKIVQKIFHKKNYEPELRVTRSCGWLRSSKDCYKADNEDHLETVCQCFTDGCNGAQGVRTQLLLIVSGVAAVLGRY